MSGNIALDVENNLVFLFCPIILCYYKVKHIGDFNIRGIIFELPGLCDNKLFSFYLVSYSSYPKVHTDGFYVWPQLLDSKINKIRPAKYLYIVELYIVTV